MTRRRFQLTESQVNGLKGAYTNCKDGPTRTRYQAVRLYGTGCPAQEVMDITGCSRTSLMEWCRQYRRAGSASLVDKRAGGNRAKLSQAQSMLPTDSMHSNKPQWHKSQNPAQRSKPEASRPIGQSNSIIN